MKIRTWMLIFAVTFCVACAGRSFAQGAAQCVDAQGLKEALKNEIIGKLTWYCASYKESTTDFDNGNDKGREAACPTGYLMVGYSQHDGRNRAKCCQLKFKESGT